MFKRTLFKLTLRYSILLILIFALFSGGVLLYMEHAFGGDYVKQARQSESESRSNSASEAADAGLDKLRTILLISDTAILLIIPTLSYQMARRTLEPVKKSYEKQQQFVDDASHELRTPLSIIQGELELALTKSRSPKEYQDAIKTSVEEVGNLSKLVTSLLLIARDDKSDLQETFQNIDLVKLVDTLINQATPADGKLHISLHCETDIHNIYGSLVLTERAISNIIDNAIKFSGSNGTITITVKSDRHYVTVTVSDNGIGMTESQLKQAYQRFWRAEEARSVKGFGLGLSLVRQIMSTQGGFLKLSSTINKGTTVVLGFSR
jgi:signal transduction histidine kinase